MHQHPVPVPYVKQIISCSSARSSCQWLQASVAMWQRKLVFASIVSDPGTVPTSVRISTNAESATAITIPYCIANQRFRRLKRLQVYLLDLISQLEQQKNTFF